MRDVLRLAEAPGLSDSFEPDTRISFFDNNIRALRVNSDLASIYGLEGAFDDGFTQAGFDSAMQPQRGGLLTQLGFLASHGGLTGSVHCGVFINHRILCTELPPPPDDIPPIPGDEGITMTSRERIEMLA